MSGDLDRDFAYIPPELDEGNEDEGFFKLTAREGLAIKAILVELLARQCDALEIYQELPAAAEFHRSSCFNRLLRGSNRAGKTLTAAAEFARAVRGEDPHGKYPKKNGVAFVFGLDGKHLGLTIFPKLFQPGAFLIIKDGDQWRTFNPNTDAARADEAIPAPPLIPPRLIAEIAWEEKKTKTPKMVRLVNGWEIWFFSSLAKMPQGQAIDLWWIDEEIDNERLLAELQARCAGAGRKGKGFWSATPQVASIQLLDLHEKAEANNPDVREWQLLIADNPYIDEETKQKLYNSWSEEERRVRWHGEYAYSAVIVYPEFSEGVHGFCPEAWGLKSSFQVPYDWPIYAAVDPGRQVCATLFLTVPPPRVGRFVLVYDELYIHKCTAAEFGRQFALKVRDRVLECIFIDHQAGRIHEMGSGQNVEEQYRKALCVNKVETRTPGCHFQWGSSDPKAGREAVHEWLRVRPNGMPGAYFYLPALGNFQHEIRRYRYKKLPGGAVTDEVEKRHDHLMDTLRYLAAACPAYVAPKRAGHLKSAAVRSLERKRQRKKDAAGGREESGHVRLG